MDFVHADDVAQVLALAALHPDPPSPAYFAANGVSYGMLEVVDHARKLVDHDVEVEVAAGDSYMSYAAPGPPFDITRAREDLGYEPRFPLEAGLRDYFDWLDRQPGSARAAG
jgi:nucleoside-diphosphate-sugar epimerase